MLEMAEGGTAFFDEIGELPLDLQAKLLRVLQEKEIRALGAVTGHKAHFRLIAATNRNLSEEVARARFRQDLFYRLNVVKLRLPALRDRKEDIPELAAHFLSRHGGCYSLTPELLEAMGVYNWPGNVRELENCIQQLVAINSGPSLDKNDLPSAVLGALAAQQANQSDLPALVNGANAGASPLIDPQRVWSLEELEKRAIGEALAHTRGDRARAALLLGIGRTTLYRKIKQYQV